ncbi:MAG TPA: hypothetical protein VLB00_03565, partial [Gemmatimonadales bacterium]|nr:hypothetical protein [Gemmatimonadales bacterium]
MGQGVLELFADAGLARDRDGALVVGGVPVEEIARSTGTPAYVYHADAIRRHYAALTSALGSVPHRVDYAVK